MLRARLGGIPVQVRSAGLAVAEPEAVSEGMVGTAREWGLDLGAHRSRRLEVDDVRDADMVLAMEHHQVADVLLKDPAAWPRTFTIKEFVRRAEAVGPRAVEEPFAAWVARVHAGRRRQDLVGAWRDDVVDPAGLPEHELDRAIGELDQLTKFLVELGWPRVRARPR